MNICFIMSDLGFGGAERVVSIITDELIRRGHDIHICLTDRNPAVSYNINRNIIVDKLETYGFLQEHILHKSKKKIIRYFSSFNPDLVITMTTGPGSIFAPICKQIGLPHIHSERNDPKSLNSKIMLKTRWKILVKSVKYVVFQTNGAMRQYPKLIQDKSVIILNPMTTVEFPTYYEGKRSKEIVSVGRLVPQKRHDVLIRAFSIVVKKHPDYCLKIYGSGECEEEYINLINELGLENKVFLMGNSQKIYDDINKSAIFALSSDFEGLPNALIEAMALGLPCISTKCSPGGAEELIQDGINGRLVECANVDALAAAIDEMLINYQKSLAMGKEAIKITELLEPKTITDAWESFFKKCVDESTGKQ